MLALDRSAVQIALVVDGSRRLVGTLTDGDIRRALLGGASLDTALAPHVRRQFTTVGPEAGRAEVLDLMRARFVQGIPMVDADGRVIGLHLMREVVGARERPNWAVVMAGGQGVRLRPLTDTVPKPMVSVAGRPILERIVLHLAGTGIRRIFLAIHYLGHTIEEYFGDGERFGVRIDYLRESEPLGSGGALSLLPEPPRDPVVVMNGDLVTEADIGAMLGFHTAHGFKATVGVRAYRHRVPFGCVEVETHRIVSIEEKPLMSRTINAGIYVLMPDLPTRVPPGSEYAMPSLITGCIARGEAVGAFVVEDDWLDVGQMDQLYQARGGSV